MRTTDWGQSRCSTAFEGTLPAELLNTSAPAIYATAAHGSTTKHYRFVSTAFVLEELEKVGFVPVQALQVACKARPMHGQHLVRLRRRHESIQIGDTIPELLLTNSHDGTSAYQLRVGLFRAACANGLIVSMGAFPVWRMAHRGDVVREIVSEALRVSQRFSELTHLVEQMEFTILREVEQLEFARAAVFLRFGSEATDMLDLSDVLLPRRGADAGMDLWRTFNVIQENILRGGLLRRLPTGRLIHTRPIEAIRERIRLNSSLWAEAVARIPN
jgi:hypothetical protein